jgi:hypothetical protein
LRVQLRMQPVSIAELLEELKSMTISFVEVIHLANYGQIEDFIERRESIVAQILVRGQEEGSLSHADKIHEILAFDQILSGRMHALKNEASGELQKMTKSKRQQSVYDTGYVRDSLFIDNKR